MDKKKTTLQNTNMYLFFFNLQGWEERGNNLGF